MPRRHTVAAYLALAPIVASSLLVIPPAPAAPATVMVSFKNGKLVVKGTAKGETITLKLEGSKIVVTANRRVKRVGSPALGSLLSIKVLAGDGNDTVNVVGPMPRVRLDGGPGNDTLAAGPGDDTVIGGPGDDTLGAAGGVDKVSGLAGDDTLSGAAGDDVLLGGDDDDVLQGEGGDDRLDGGGGNDLLVGGPGADGSAGRTGDDTYSFDLDGPQGSDVLTEVALEGADRIDLSATATTGAVLDLGSAASQLVAGSSISLSDATTFEDATGTSLADTFSGNSGVNTWTGGPGQDHFRHPGPGGGIDRVTDMASAQGDQVRFVGGTTEPRDLTLDPTASHLRDVAGTFGFDFDVPVVSASFYGFGTTDTVPEGSLFTFVGTGGFSIGSNTPSGIWSFNSAGATIGGAGDADVLVDHSPNGNTLAGRDGPDILDGGAGNDSLNGDGGFNAGSDDEVTGGSGADTFIAGIGFAAAVVAFGNDTYLDFATEDAIDLPGTLSVRMGLGTTVVTIWNGTTNFGTITTGSGRNFVAGDFV